MKENICRALFCGSPIVEYELSRARSTSQLANRAATLPSLSRRISQIYPPVGFNLFVLQGSKGVDILRIAKAALPLYFLLLLAVVLITVFPDIGGLFRLWAE